MKKIIMSRPNISAKGLDGISNAVWKINLLVPAQLCIKLLLSIMNIKIAPLAWRRSKMIMIYKKGGPASPRSWRPIAFTPTLYRIAMSSVADAFQEVNLG